MTLMTTFGEAYEGQAGVRLKVSDARVSYELAMKTWAFVYKAYK